MTNVLDLFAGAGGWDIAAHRLGVSPVGLELDDDCCATRKAAGLRTMQCDIAAVHLTPQCGWYPGRRGLIASPPCQGFSRAGKGKGLGDAHLIQTAMHHLAAGMDVREQLGAECADERSMLVVEPLRWALALEPRWIALEQVPSVLPFWDLTAEILGTRGYNCWTGLLHAEQFGVPQTRKRAFLIASLDGPVGPPAPTHSKYHVRDPQRLDDGVLPWLSMAKALGWGMTRRPGYTITGGGTDTGGAEPWGSQSRAGARRQMSEGHWSSSRPSTTVNCDPRISPPGRHDPNVSGSQQAGALRVTPEEAARLQSFPTFPFQGSRTSIFRQIGNSVCPAWAIPILGEAMRIDWREAHSTYLRELGFGV